MPIHGKTSCKFAGWELAMTFKPSSEDNWLGGNCWIKCRTLGNEWAQAFASRAAFCLSQRGICPAAVSSLSGESDYKERWLLVGASHLEDWFEEGSAKYESGVIVRQGVAESRNMAVAQPACVVHLQQQLIVKIRFQVPLCKPCKLTHPRYSFAVFVQLESLASSGWGSGGTSWPNRTWQTVKQLEESKSRPRLTSFAILLETGGWIWREQSWWRP